MIIKYVSKMVMLLIMMLIVIMVAMISVLISMIMILFFSAISFSSKISIINVTLKVFMVTV